MKFGFYSCMSGMPWGGSEVLWQRAARLLQMEEELEKTVMGQREAVSVIARALRRSRADALGNVSSAPMIIAFLSLLFRFTRW